MEIVRLASRILCVLLLGVAAALSPSELRGSEIYVAPNGNDANPGTFDLPKKNAQLVLNSLSPGDTLYFRGGFYQFNDTLTLSKSGGPESWITIASAPGETAILDGSLTNDDDDSILEVRGQNYVQIENLRLQNSKDQGISVWKSKHVVVRNNHTYNTYGPGIGVWGDAGARVPSQYITVWNNKVEKPNSWDAPGYHPNPAPNHPPHEGISLGRVEDFEVAYNEVWGGEKEGIDSKGPNKRGTIHHNYVHNLPRVGIYVDAWTSGIEDIEVHNNIVHDSYSSGLSGLVSINSEDNQTVDNIRVHHNLGFEIKRRIFHVNGSPLTSNVHIWNNTGLDADHGALLTGNLQNITIQNNIFNNIGFQIIKDDSTGTGRDIGYNLLNANPAFVNAAGKNYHLAPGSAAVNAGNPDPFYNDPDGTRNDVGAFHLGQTNTSWDYWLGTGWDEGEPPHPWDLSDPGGPGDVDLGYEPAEVLFYDDFIMDPLAPGPVGRGGAAPSPTNGWAESGNWVNTTKADAFGTYRSVARGLTGSLTRTIATTGYENVAIQLFVMQDESASYETLEDVDAKLPNWSDFFELQINTGSGWESVLVDHGQWNGQDEPAAAGWGGEPGNDFNDPTAFLDLPAAADDNPSLQVRLITHSSQSNELWYIDYFQLRGDLISPPLAGDYNDDGVVNLADYTVWRDHLGDNVSLPNDPYGDANGGSIGVQQYLQWKQHLGMSQPQFGVAAVPSPSGLALLLGFVVVATLRTWLKQQWWAVWHLRALATSGIAVDLRVRPMQFSLVATALITACATDTSAVGSDPYQGLPLANGSKVLFIGNSLVGASGGGLGAYVDAALNAGPAKIDIDRRRINQWGESLQTHYHAPAGSYASQNQTDMANTSLTAHQYIQQGLNGQPWDVVVLQDYNDDIDDPDTSARYIRKFVQEIRAAGAQPVLMARWYGHFDNLSDAQWAQKQDAIMAHYDRMGAELDVPVVPLAAIWKQLTQDPPQAGLEKWWLYTDAVHQDEEGKAANTYAFYSLLTRLSPLGVPLQHHQYNDASNPSLDAAIEQAAWQVIQQRAPWTTGGEWVPPEANGTVTARVDEQTGRVELEISGAVQAIQFGAPFTAPGAGPLASMPAELDRLRPVQSDDEIIAWYGDGELFAPGRYDLGEVLAPGTSLADLQLAYTSGVGTGSLGEVLAMPPPLAGDYNADGVVNLADYTTWRDRLGSYETLPNDPHGDSHPGPVSVAHYDQWKASFVASATVLTESTIAAVPSPGGLQLVGIVLAIGVGGRCRNRMRWSTTEPTGPVPGRRLTLLLLAVLAAVFGCWGASAAADSVSTGITVGTLTAEHLVDPLGIDRAEPRLGWKIKDPSSRRGLRQTAYQVLVASTPALLQEHKGDRWDSGIVESDQSVAVTYGGHPLKYGDRCYWKVKVRTDDGEWTPWSKTAYWSIGPMHGNDWSAKWIGPGQEHVPHDNPPADDAFFADPWLRKTFQLEAAPYEAVIYVASVGYHELYVNGQKVGDTVLEPSVSDHSQRARYVTYDITTHLLPGKNVIGLWLGTSWSIFPPYQSDDRPDTPIAIAQAELRFADGVRQQVVTDGSWKVHASPNVLLGTWWFRNYGGEFYDAALEINDWSDPSLDDIDWPLATVYPVDLVLSAAAIEPNRRQAVLAPVRIESLGDDTYRIDLGKNHAGLLEIDLQGQPGDVITLDWSEHPDQRQTHKLHSAYRLGRSGLGTFRNRFNYGSGRWITVAGVSSRPAVDDVRSYMVRSDYRRIGEFECSNPLLNQIYETTCWTFENLSLGGYVVDCPQRERMGYGGDAHATTQMAVNTYGLAAFYAKWCQDWRDVQGHRAAWGTDANANTRASVHEGELPYTAPTYWGGGGPIWSGICVTLPWYTYRHFGDLSVLDDNFPMMEAWLRFLETKSEGDLLRRWGGQWDFLGDWLWPGASGVNGDTRESLFLNNCYWVYNLTTAAKAAEALGYTQKAEEYRRRAEVIRRAIHREFFDPQTGAYVNNMQAYLAIALLVNIPPDDLRPQVEQRFVEEIVQHRDGHFWGGITGGYFIFKQLLACDRQDLAYLMVSQTDYPSWGHMLRQGATTVWESWEGEKSRLHSSYLHVGAWFMEGLAGIVPDEAHPGYKHFFVRPGTDASDSLDWVEASYDSPYGKIAVRWERSGDDLSVYVRVPPNTTATVLLPAKDDSEVTEGEVPIEQAPSVTAGPRTADRASYTVSAGDYHFKVHN